MQKCYRFGILKTKLLLSLFGSRINLIMTNIPPDEDTNIFLYPTKGFSVVEKAKLFEWLAQRELFLLEVSNRDNKSGY